MFCFSNETSSSGGMLVWIESGFTFCFYDTLTTSILFGFIFLFGLVQYIFYKRFGFKIEREYIDASFLYSFQVVLTILLACEPTLLYATESTALGQAKLPGYAIYRCILRTFTWLFSLMILRIERTKTMPTAQTRGHGLIILTFWCLAVLVEIFTLISYRSPYWFFQSIIHRNSPIDEIDLVRFSYWIFRLIATIFIFSIGLRAPGVPRRRYAIMLNRSPSQIEEDNLKENVWVKFFKHFKTLAPYIWPRGHCGLQINIMICIFILLTGRLLALQVPLYTKLITDELINSTNATTDTFLNLGARLRSPTSWPWRLITVLMVIRWLQGAGLFGSGLLGIIRSTLWTKIEQYTTRTLKLRVFSHLHHLSLRWHLTRKTGEVLRIVDRGTDSVDSLLNYILFNIFPTIADIVIAIIYFIVKFNIWFGIIVFATMFIYLLSTIAITEWRTKYKKEMNKFDNSMGATAVDSLLNFETVKYYGAEGYEVEQYRDAIEKYQKGKEKIKAKNIDFYLISRMDQSTYFTIIKFYSINFNWYWFNRWFTLLCLACEY
jgi:ATP-binding cassette subfamily B (MDR/TAP) protein 6